MSNKTQVSMLYNIVHKIEQYKHKTLYTIHVCIYSYGVQYTKFAYITKVSNKYRVHSMYYNNITNKFVYAHSTLYEFIAHITQEQTTQKQTRAIHNNILKTIRASK